MSEANVELVQRLQPRPGADLASLIRDDSRWRRVAAVFEPHVEAEFESGFVRGGERTSYRGIEGLRQTWLDWLEPWESYRTEIEKIVAHGAHVLLLVDDYGRRHGMRVEVPLRGAAVWTVRDGRLARAFFYTDRDVASSEAGLPIDAEPDV